jgi:hypothetical protein
MINKEKEEIGRCTMEYIPGLGLYSFFLQTFKFIKEK